MKFVKKLQSSANEATLSNDDDKNNNNNSNNNCINNNDDDNNNVFEILESNIKIQTN